MEQLTIELDCIGDRCGNCKLIWEDDEGFPHCAPFDKEIKGEFKDGHFTTKNPFRLPECIETCKKQYHRYCPKCGENTLETIELKKKCGNCDYAL